MKLLVQRVSRATCTVDGAVTGSIERGLVAYVGFTTSDTLSDIQYLARKLAHLRIFNDATGVMNESLLDQKLSVLSISQFTLYGDTSKGHRPSYSKAMDPVHAEQMYHQFNQELSTTYNLPVATGVFGAHMVIDQTNDGPVTIELRSKQS